MAENISNQYAEYMDFKSPEDNPWAESTLNKYLKDLGEPSPNVTRQDAESIQFCYDQSPTARTYHSAEHGEFMGQPYAPEVLLEQTQGIFSKEEVEAILAIAGLFHDVARKHVDVRANGGRAWSHALSQQIGEIARYTLLIDGDTRIFTTYATQAGQEDPSVQIVAHQFNVDISAGAGIEHNKGGDEFDSALAAAKFLENNGATIADDKKVAILTAIAATVPFRPASTRTEDGQITDGYMGELANRLAALGMPWNKINAIMAISVHFANRDISAILQRGNFPKMISDGRRLKAEDIADYRLHAISTIQDLAHGAGREKSAPYLYDSLSGTDTPIPAANVPHLYIPRDADGNILDTEFAYPPIPVYEQAVKNTEHNAGLASLFFKAHEVGICTVASIATLIGEAGARVPGIVRSSRWSSYAEPTAEQIAALPPSALNVYEELMHGKNQIAIDEVTTNRSPVSGYILGVGGRTLVEHLSQTIAKIRENAKQNHEIEPFARQEHAKKLLKEVVDAIGQQDFEVIMDELIHVANYYIADSERGNPTRPARLEELRDNVEIKLR